MQNKIRCEKKLIHSSFGLIIIITNQCIVRSVDITNTYSRLSRNTALGSGSFLQFSFFPQKYPLRPCGESNNIGDWLIQSKKDGKDQESIQSSTTPDPGYQWESNKLTVRHHRRELGSQDNLQIYYSSASATVHSKGTETR